MKSLIKDIGAGASALIYPPRCPVCDRILERPLKDFVYPPKNENVWICKKCRKKLKPVTEPSCRKCGKPLMDEGDEYCYDCLRSNHSFEEGKSLWEFEGQVREMLHRFKYAGRKDYADFLGTELELRYGRWISEKKIQAIIPIPISYKRYMKREYNQAYLIAKSLSKLAKIDVCGHLLLRSKKTEEQNKLNRQERKNNLKNAFFLTQNVVNLKRVLLVDDIFTTGSTMDAASELLLESGIGKVYCITIAVGRSF